jgi:hypothetical protein
MPVPQVSTIQASYQGESRYPEIEATKIEYSNLVVRLPDTFADGFLKWHDEFIIDGRSDSSNEKSGTLEFFAPNSDKPYFGINLGGLGMISLAMGKSALRTKTGGPVTVQMYCETMKFYAGAAAIT